MAAFQLIVLVSKPSMVDARGCVGACAQRGATHQRLGTTL
jgi:hypothetical protein